MIFVTIIAGYIVFSVALGLLIQVGTIILRLLKG